MGLKRNVGLFTALAYQGGAPMWTYLLHRLGGIARQSAAPGLVAALGQRTELEGKPAVAFPVRFVDGAVFLGPFQVGMVSPLF